MKSGFDTKSGGEAGGGKGDFVPPPVNWLGKLFTQLEIIELLGHGGMGAVYKARQPRLNRFVALKILSPEKQSDPQFAERFEREARALAALTHPNIVAVYDFGQVQGIYYLLMEFVDGPTLRQLYQARKLAPVEALKIVPKICEALEYAHQGGVVHRDIKPENILLDRKGQVKIADFGIAKIVDLEAKDLSLTGAKDVIGTVHYMAPEQVEKPQEVDHRADIYSLGVVFYEMLTGELPLGKFQPPSKKVQIDVRLDEVVLHALEKEPERRYQTAQEVKTDVETIATTNGGGATASQPPAAAPAAAQLAGPRTNGWKIAALVGGVALVAVMAIGLVVMLIGVKPVLKGNPTIVGTGQPKPAAPQKPRRPISWWRAGGNALDSPRKNNGELVNGVRFADGISGKSFRFNGNGAYVKIPQSPSLNFNEQLTIEFWMKADPRNKLDSAQGLVTSDFYFVNISKGQGETMGVNFGIVTGAGANQDPNNGLPAANRPMPLEEANHLESNRFAGSAVVADCAQISDANGGGAPVASDEWRYIVATYDGTKLQLYIDGIAWGQPVFRTGTIRPMLPNSFVAIGSEDGRTSCPECVRTRYFNGLIDEIKVYNVALTPKEVAGNYQAALSQN